jgi:hypothetical protein
MVTIKRQHAVRCTKDRTFCALLQALVPFTIPGPEHFLVLIPSHLCVWWPSCMPLCAPASPRCPAHPGSAAPPGGEGHWVEGGEGGEGEREVMERQ